MSNIKSLSQISIIALFILGLLGYPSISLAGFGVSPPGIIADRLVAGSHLEKTIYLVQGAQKSDIDIEVHIDKTEIEDWLSFKPGIKFTIPAGVQQFPLTVIIDVPKKVDLGVYKAFIRVNTSPKKIPGEDNQVSIALGGRIDVDLTVGDEVISEFTVKNVKIHNIKQRQSPRVSISIENTGNVPVAPGRMSFELFNKYADLRLAYVEKDDFEKIQSFKTDTIEVEFPLDIKLGVGEYWGILKIYDGGVVVREYKAIFNVTEQSFFQMSIIPGIIIILIALLYFVRARIFKLFRRS